MNERIKEFAEQCEEWIQISEDEGECIFNREKFAELIVKECVQLMIDERDMCAHTGTYESREYYERMEAKEDAFNDAANKIRYHFGVE